MSPPLRATTSLVLALASLAAASAQAPCFGEFSTCPDGSCALTLDACGRCPATQYACPLSTACFAPGADGGGFSSCPNLAGTHYDASLPLEARLDYIFSQQWTAAEFISQMTENATDVPRLSIPRYSWLNDDQHGVKEADATAFPNGVSLGATFDAALLHDIGLAIGTEARGTHNSLTDKSGETGGKQWPGTIDNGAGLTLYAPNVNLVPGEDPLLTGALMSSYVRGLQNNSARIDDAGTLLTVACAKHWAVYNIEDIPHSRQYLNVDVNGRDLWETYVPAFEALIVDGQVQSIMCSYNAVNGVPTCASGGLIDTIARKAFKFQGFVVSDYDAWENLVTTHGFVKTFAEAAAVGLAAGLDQEGGGGPTYPPVQQGIPAALADGSVTLAQLETSVRRLMRVRLLLGMFDPPATNPYNAITHDAVASPANLALAELAAREGIVLLKNDAGALPLALRKGLKIALIGPNANATYGLLGSYSDPHCCTAGIPSLHDELSARVARAGATLTYAQGCVSVAGHSPTACNSTAGFAAAAAAATAADVSIVVLGMGNSNFACGGVPDTSDCEAEAHDRPTCVLPGAQAALLAAVRAATARPVIGVLVHGGALCLDAPTIGAADAWLDLFYPGMRGGAAAADALIGAFSPAGRSPVSWYASDAALPANRAEMSPYANASTGSPGITYRFYDEAVGAPRPFTFGEGLSYTTFAATAPVAPASVGPCDAIPVSVTVRNTGAVRSDVVVTLFLAQDASVPAPLTRLVSFTRVRDVAPGAAVDVTLPPVRPNARAVIHDDGSDVYAIAGKRWTEAGTLRFRVVLGEHGGDREGGLAFTVAQVGAQDISTC